MKLAYMVVVLSMKTMSAEKMESLKGPLFQKNVIIGQLMLPAFTWARMAVSIFTKIFITTVFVQRLIEAFCSHMHLGYCMKKMAHSKTKMSSHF